MAMTTIHGILLGVSFTLGDHVNSLTSVVKQDGAAEESNHDADPSGRWVVDGVDHAYPAALAALAALPNGSRAVLHADVMRYGTVTAGEFYPPGAPA